MQPSHRRILRWALGALAAVIVVGVVLAANLAAQLSGGWDEVFDLSHPLPDDPDVVATRVEAGALVDAEIVRVVDGVVVPALTGGRVAQQALTEQEAQSDRGVGFDSGCEVGFHDWKRDDPYDLLCVEIRRAVVAADQAAVAPDLTALHQSLVADGWQPREESSGLPAALERAEAETGASAGASISGADMVSALRPADYVSADGRFALQVSFQNIDTYTGRPMPTLAGDEYAAMVSISRESVQE